MDYVLVLIGVAVFALGAFLSWIGHGIVRLRRSLHDLRNVLHLALNRDPVLGPALEDVERETGLRVDDGIRD